MTQSDFRADLMKGKVVVVSGGGTGIGLGIVKAFGSHGAKVAIGGRRQEVLDAAVKELADMGIEAMGVRCDVRDADLCNAFTKAAYDKWGRVDVLVNNAAGNFSVPIEQLTPNGFKTVMEIDLHGSFNMSKAALPYLKECGSGLIIHIGATLHRTAHPFQMHASAAKSAIEVMSNNMGNEWGVDHNIRSVVVEPGPIENTTGGPTGRVFGALMKSMGTDDTRAFVPIGRFGTVDDIGNTCLFLASNAGSYINATSVIVDGGQWHNVSGRYLMAKKMVAKMSQQEKATHKGGVKTPDAKL